MVLFSATGPEIDPLRQRTSALAPELNFQPAISDETQTYFFGSRAAMQEWKDKSDPAKLEDAIEQLNDGRRRTLIAAAPWAISSSIFSLPPNASHATQVKQKMYMLEYKAGELTSQSD